jgi:hypothetical protein
MENLGQILTTHENLGLYPNDLLTYLRKKFDLVREGRRERQ